MAGNRRAARDRCEPLTKDLRRCRAARKRPRASAPRFAESITVRANHEPERPVDADIHAIETMLVWEDDKVVNPLGVKGMGELEMAPISKLWRTALICGTIRRARSLRFTEGVQTDTVS